MGGGNKNISDREIVAACATEPDAVPRVDDFALRGGEEQDARDRRAIGTEARLIAIYDPAATHNPVGMLATTRERPLTGDAIAAIHHRCVPGWSKHACRSDVRVVAINFSRRLRRQISAKHVIPAADRQTPAHRAVRFRDLFENTDKRQRIGLFAAECARNPKAKQSGLCHCFHQRRREASRLLDFIARMPGFAVPIPLAASTNDNEAVLTLKPLQDLFLCSVQCRFNRPGL